MSAEPLPEDTDTEETEADTARKISPREWSSMYNVTRPPNWEGANCTTTDTELFFLERNENQYKSRLAKKVCASCIKRVECLNYAVENHIMYGIWGGLSYKERLEFQKVRSWANQTE